MIVGQWLATLSSNEAIFFLLAACVMALACFFLVFYYLKRARLIEDAPTSRIRSAAQGYVELVGAVSTGEAGELMAPLSGTPCVWFDYKVQRYSSSGKRGHWHTINRGTSDQWFQIDDRTGVCIIDPQGAEVMTEHSRTWYGDSENPMQPKDEGHGLFRVLAKRRYRYIEKFIYIHDVIYALGYFHSLGGGRHIPNTQKMIGAVIREWKQNYDQVLHRFDQDGNGEIDMQEWENVRDAASQEADKRRSNLAKALTKHMLSQMPNKQFPFIISTHSQKKLAKQFRYYAVGILVGGIFFSYVMVQLTLEL
tara:strand:+ start:874 stop:1797 length:924 start_codon:yes stop_codon:yes gene_type:complete